jgi:glyoxylate reductase
VSARKTIALTRHLPEQGLRGLIESGISIEKWPEDRPLIPDEIDAIASKSDALCTMLTDKIDRDFLKRNRHLKAIANYAVGTNNIDLLAAREFGIPVSNTPDVLTTACAECAMGMMISVCRHFKRGEEELQRGEFKQWGPRDYLGLELKGAVLGIVGMGRIGEAFARRAIMGFDMKVVYYSRTKKASAEELGAQHVSLNELLRISDVVSLHCPLNADNHLMMSEAQFSMMKRGSYFLNTSRGGLVDHDALNRAIENGHLAGAGLDVTDPEPLLANSPLLGKSNVMITPHLASATHAARIAMVNLVAENLIAGLEGRLLPNLV